LKTRRLHQPQVLDVAMSKDEDSRVTVTEYCTIAPEDPSRKWFSRPVRALIVPVLCASVILGLPFLASNEIVIDYSARSVVARPSGFDLLRPADFVVRPRVPVVSPPTQRRVEADQIRKGRAAVRKGFASVLEEIEVLGKLSLALVGEQASFGPSQEQLAAAVEARILHLENEELLKAKSDKLKSDYADVFGDIPHVDELPEDIKCSIKLKAPNVPMQSRGYVSPQTSRRWTDSSLFFRIFVTGVFDS
ncbi:hypothetical protein F5880DRAFT_1512799, partial [Lentinula raphanica]